MIARKVFLGTVEAFLDDEDALSLHNMENIFSFIQSRESDFVDYDVKTNSSTLFDKEEHHRNVVSSIFDADVCIIDVTPKLSKCQEKYKARKCIDFLLESCHLLNKKVIYLYNKEVGRIFSINDVYKETDLAKDETSIKRRENDLGVFPHDGTAMEVEAVIELSQVLDHYFEKFPNYQKTKRISLETGSIHHFEQIFEDWRKDYGLSNIDFYHAYFEENQIRIRCEWYDSFLAQLILDLSNVQEEEKDDLMRSIRNNYEESFQFYVHDFRNMKNMKK